MAFLIALKTFSLGRVVLYTVFLVFPLPETLVKTLAKNLVKNLAPNLAKKSSDKGKPKGCQDAKPLEKQSEGEKSLL